MTSHQDPDILRQCVAVTPWRHEKGMRSGVLRASSRRPAHASSVFLQRVPVSGNGSDTRWCFLPVPFCRWHLCRISFVLYSGCPPMFMGFSQCILSTQWFCKASFEECCLRRTCDGPVVVFWNGRSREDASGLLEETCCRIGCRPLMTHSKVLSFWWTLLSYRLTISRDSRKISFLSILRLLWWFRSLL